MTGRKADAPKIPEATQQAQAESPKTNVQSSWKHPHISSKKADGKDSMGPYNVFDVTIMPTILRPAYQRPNYNIDNLINKHTTDPSENFDRTRSSGLPSDVGAQRLRSQDSPSSDSNKRLNHSILRRRRRSLSSDSDSILKRRRRSPSSDSDTPLIMKNVTSVDYPTPSLTHALSTTSFANHQDLVDLDSLPEYPVSIKQEDECPKTADTAEIPSMQSGRRAQVAVKEESLPAYETSRTIFLVKASNMPDRAPVYVPLELCRSSRELFTRLASERQLDARAAEKVKCIDATCTWGLRKSHGIRKNSEDDWKRFIKNLRKAWEVEKFQDECEVQMMIHVDG